MGNGSSTRSGDVSFALSESESDIATKLTQHTADGRKPDVILLFVRHGFSCANFVKETRLIGGGLSQGLQMMGGFPASPLNAAGIAQAEAFGAVLKHISDDDKDIIFSPEFYSSNLPRAIETAFYIQKLNMFNFCI